MITVFVVIWMVVGVITALGGIFVAGYNHNDMESEKIISGGFLLGIFWPLLLIFLIVLTPLWGIYKLGELLSNNDQLDI